MMIKVCGMRDADNIREVDALGVTFIGHIFYPKSPRFVSQMPEYLPEKALRAGVFVNAAPEEVLAYVQDYHLDAIQLHGDETLAYTNTLHKLLEPITAQRDIFMVKAIPVKSRSEVLKASLWDGSVDGILFETPGNLYGGHGVSFDWSLLQSYRGQTPFFISGGIGPASLDSLLQFRHPAWLGIDLNSRFETAPGVKDVEALRKFIAAFREVFPE